MKSKKAYPNKNQFFKENINVSRLGILGSYVRGDQHQESDLDVLIDYEDAPSLITLIDLEYYLYHLTLNI